MHPADCVLPVSQTLRLRRYRERGVKTASAFAGQLEQVALAMPQLCCSLYLQAAGHMRQVVLFSDMQNCTQIWLCPSAYAWH